jgi:2-polyprenyl-3-methyl-5-hydroxy-6-metoxy-1,4-benzoquinol methylase
MSSSQYSFDNDWLKARQRLSALEMIEDPATIDHLREIGVAEGWHCLEVGGGGGSIAEWLCRRVGPAGYVMATDVNPRHLETIDFPQMKAIRHNVVTDDLEVSRFDLVHTRNLLIHLAERVEVICKLAEAVKPGGWILIEETDFVTNRCDPTIGHTFGILYARIMQEVYRSVEDRGVDIHCGERLFGMLHTLGFELLNGEGRAKIFQGGAAAAEYNRLTYEQLKGPVVAAGRVEEREYDDFLALFGNPSFLWRGPLRVSVWGRRPSSCV